MPSDPLHDRSDFRALQEEDEGALARIIARWERPLLAFAWRYLRHPVDAREAVADTFVRLHQHRHRLRADTHLSAWLFTTLANRCRNEHRWRRRHPTVSLDPRPDDSGEDGRPLVLCDEQTPEPGTVLAREEAVAALDAAIALLPHDLKTALFLHHFEQLSYREIGAIIGCQERGVETRLYRARRRLRQALLPLREQLAGH